MSEVSKVVFGGETIIDLTSDTVTPETLAEGYTAHAANGQKVTGTMPTTTVLYTDQTLTNDQKSQARTNIGAASQDALNKKANDYSLEIYNGTGGNPNPVKFMTVNYSTCGSENGVAIKVGMVSGHGNGSSYAFLQDAIIKVTHTGTVTVDNFKYYGASTDTYDGASRQHGDIFWVIDTTNKIVDFYCLMGQYARLQMVPYKRVTYSTGGVITQHTTATPYSSGEKVWGNNSEIALKSDIPVASSTANGLMSKEDKANLDNIVANMITVFSGTEANMASVGKDGDVYLVTE